MKELFEWPDGKRCAVMLSFDVDGETTWANGNKNRKNGELYLRSLSIGRYGPKRCVGEILNLLNKHKIKATFFIPSLVVKNNPILMKEITSEGHEIGHHGYAHECFYDKTYEEQVEIIDKSQKIFEEVIGEKAIGFRTPSGDWAEFTPELIVKKGFKYSSSMRGFDFPYRTIIKGKKSDLIEIPTKWELDDYVQMAYNLFPPEPIGQDRISNYKDVFENFRWEFEGYYELGLCISYMFHPQVIGTPGRLILLDELIEFIKNYNDVWFATGSQISDWVREIL